MERSWRRWTAQRGGHSLRAGTRLPKTRHGSCLGAGGRHMRPQWGSSSLTLHLVKTVEGMSRGASPGRVPSVPESCLARGWDAGASVLPQTNMRRRGLRARLGSGSCARTRQCGWFVHRITQGSRGAHRRPWTPTEASAFWCRKSGGGERTEEGLEESQCPCRGATGSHEPVGHL